MTSFLTKIVAATGFCLLASAAHAQQPPPPTPPNNCGMVLGGPAIFCEPFDVVNPGTPSRTGALDPNVWGVSRASGSPNTDQGYNAWGLVTIPICGAAATVEPPNDIQICNGQLREAVNDNPVGCFECGTVTSLAMYPKQPFDFAGRTGTVSFDVSNNAGQHGAWPEFWISDLPVPDPFSQFNSWESLPANGFGVRFDNAAPIGQGGECPNENNLDKLRFTVDSAAVVRNYVLDDTLGYGPGIATLTLLDCAIESTDPSQLNHIELRISQNQIDVYSTDAGVAATSETLKHIAVINNANLTLTRGLIWIEDVHYNGDKILDTTRPSQRQNTFVWDNVAFDGPFTQRDFSYDSLDALQSMTATSVALGQSSFPNQTASWNVLNMPANPQAAAVKVLFNFYPQPDSTVINVIVNGNAHTVPWPYPDMIQDTWRTFAVTIPITDLVPGTNVVQLGSDQFMVTSNVNIVLADVPGGAPVLPGSVNTYPGPGQTPVPTVNLTASPTSIPVGQSSILTWSSTNATACSASGGWSGTPAANGVRSVTPSASTTYTLTCTGAGGSGAASASVVVSSTLMPTVNLTATPMSITAGQSSVLIWTLAIF
jgi:hypothetical protein